MFQAPSVYYLRLGTGDTELIGQISQSVTASLTLASMDGSHGVTRQRIL